MKTASFKNTDIGPIPDDWEVKKLGELCEVLDNRRVPLNDSQRKKGPYPYCGANGIVDYIDRYAFEGKVILIAEDGGNFSDFATRPIAYQMDGKFWVNNHAHVLVSKEGVCQEFLFCQLVHKDITDVISGGTRAKLTRGQLDDLLMVLPPLPEQRRIAAALSDADKLVAALDKLIEKKKRVKEGAMQRLLSGETRLLGFTGKWEIENFGEAFMFLRNNTLPRACLSDQGTVSDIHYGDVLIRYGSILDFAKETPPFIGSPFKQNVPCEFLQDGDLVVADTAEDETTGKAVEIVNLKTRKAVAGLHTIPCRPHRKFAPGWLGFYVNSSTFHDQLLPLMSGTKVLSVSRESLKSVFIARPEEKEQRAIAAVLADMDAEIAALSRERAEAERIKQGMMQELLTGKTRLAEGE